MEGGKFRGWRVKRYEDQWMERLEGQKVERLEGQRVERLEGQRVEMVEGQRIERLEEKGRKASLYLPPFLPYTFHTKILGGDLWSPPSNKIYSPA